MSSIIPGPVENSNAIRLELLSWPEVERYLTNCKGVVLPIGSTEQHGPTGAIGTDAMTAEAVALEVGRRTGVLVTPTQPFGMAEHHLGFPGTMSLKPSTLLEVLNDLFLSLISNGFERIFVVNGHGGNIATTKAAFAQVHSNARMRKISCASEVRFKLANWFMAPSVSLKAKELYGEREGQHATPSEIALTMHLEPDLILKQRPLNDPVPAGAINGSEDFRLRYPDGRMGSDPYLAKADHGAVLLDKAASYLCNDLSQFLEAL